MSESTKKPLGPQQAAVDFARGKVGQDMMHRDLEDSLDGMIKRRRYHIEVGEVESARCRHERLKKVAAMALPGEDQGISIAVCCVAQGGESLPSIGMKRPFRQHLPAYMVPDSLVWLNDLPLTSTGKWGYQTLSRNAAL